MATVFVSPEESVPVGARLLVRRGVRVASSMGSALEQALSSHVARLDHEDSWRTSVVSHEGFDVFLERVHPVPHVFVLGSRHDASPLIEIARSVGFRVTGVDRTASLTTRERFREADRFVIAKPAELLELVDAHHTALAVVMSHDYERDRDYLGALLESRARYIGMLGPERRTRRMLAELAQVGKPVDRSEWDMTPPTVNAYYNPSMNEMVFPAGILQSPFYSKEAPASVNFGGLGMVMGHELTHGFDDEGRQFDAQGNLKEWWSPTVSAEFDKRASCVADQFDGYVAVDDLHVNGKLTLGENLADLGGAKLALAVVHATLPPADEVDRQFFFGIAQVWCGSMRPENARMRVRVDPHSPAQWRVNGPLSNLPEFAHAFACRAGDAMVRSDEKRCSVW